MLCKSCGLDTHQRRSSKKFPNFIKPQKWLFLIEDDPANRSMSTFMVKKGLKAFCPSGALCKRIDHNVTEISGLMAEASLNVMVYYSDLIDRDKVLASGTVIPHGETGGLQIEDHSNFVYKIAPFIETRARGCPIRRGRAQITGQFEKRQEQYRANNDPGSCQVGKSSADTIQYVYYRLHFLLDARAVYAQKNMLECNGTAKDPGEVLKTVWLTNSRRKLFHHMQDVCWFASGIGELHRKDAETKRNTPDQIFEEETVKRFSHLNYLELRNVHLKVAAKREEIKSRIKDLKKAQAALYVTKTQFRKLSVELDVLKFLESNKLHIDRVLRELEEDADDYIQYWNDRLSSSSSNDSDRYDDFNGGNSNTLRV
ncbi:hypothetical protein V9T40_002366 [Parthenolecanium corni]|uniref:Uncharacterized protein n=1 Tax=Parthenolecanium corni TaxID=536013 RepID=A0AAN9TKN3_9HEMI